MKGARINSLNVFPKSYAGNSLLSHHLFRCQIDPGRAERKRARGEKRLMLTAAASPWLRLTTCCYRLAKKRESKSAASTHFLSHRSKDHGCHLCWLELPGVDLPEGRKSPLSIPYRCLSPNPNTRELAD